MPKISDETLYRSRCNVELRAISNGDGEERMQFEGYAIVFEEPALAFEDSDGTRYYEVIDRNALSNTDMSDVIMRYNHSLDWILARNTKSLGEGSLVLTPDEHGLKVKGEFVNNTYSRDIYAMMVADVLNQMSFAFTIRDYRFDSATKTTRITDIKKLYDVSAVDTPFYPTTSISACRSKVEFNKQQEIERARQGALDEVVRKLLIIDVMDKLNN